MRWWWRTKRNADNQHLVAIAKEIERGNQIATDSLQVQERSGKSWRFWLIAALTALAVATPIAVASGWLLESEPNVSSNPPPSIDRSSLPAVVATGHILEVTIGVAGEDEDWSSSVETAPGETVTVLVTVANASRLHLDDVTIVVSGSDWLRYMPSSQRFFSNNTESGGLNLGDSQMMTSGGVNVGSLPPGANAHLTLRFVHATETPAGVGFGDDVIPGCTRSGDFIEVIVFADDPANTSTYQADSTVAAVDRVAAFSVGCSPA